MKKVKELKAKLLTKIFFGEMEGKKHRGAGFMEYVLVLAVSAGIYLVVSGKGADLISKLWTWIDKTIGTITK